MLILHQVLKSATLNNLETKNKEFISDFFVFQVAEHI